MTRHTRNRQLERYNPDYLLLTIGNVPIEYVRGELKDEVYIDPTFRWTRTERANFKYDADANVTHYYVDKNVIHWTKIERGVIVKYNMNPKVGRTMSYRLWGKKDA